MSGPSTGRVAAVMLGLGLLVACGGGDSKPDRATPTTTVTTTVSTTTSSSSTSTTTPPSTTSTIANTTGSALTTGSELHLRGVGPVHAGMTVRQAEQAAGVPLQIEGFEYFDGRCYYAIPEGLENLGFMVGSPDQSRPDDPLDGVILRAEARGAPWQTTLGIQVGSTSAEVAEAYGVDVVTEPHVYQEGGQYLTIGGTGGDTGFGIRFETNPEHVVESIFAGDAGAITAIEGCA